MKSRIYELVEKGSHGRRLNQMFDNFIMSLIVMSLVSIILESIPDVHSKYSEILYGFNILSIGIFTIEYFMRIYVSDVTHPSETRLKSASKFIFSTYGLIDLLAILPFFLPMLIKIDLRFLRALRLTRFLRILKLNRYNDSLNLIWAVIKEKKSELAVTGFLTFLILMIASFLMYHIEGDKQPEAFSNILESFWWAVATLTTVGYGDIYPITGLGKFISGLIAILGIGIVALPTGIVGAGFMAKVEQVKQKKEDRKCPHCGCDLLTRQHEIHSN
ncbi:ion transporter [Ancylomarina euxinus]|uniref:Ion transporter n=1 Tax=Ancylomarina euxinus TaxID=2283627 RepID=A0A425XZT1_9BACT|nr:ion transporter [Ancylomarina euxinus]MCZ4695489.1 ion transporter [Ancylomarina euxinus]MUP15693.1 ion transporter [Ancylomarina euxinus]RRG20686.1 ion transporter [Ancylomarina euxinus]